MNGSKADRPEAAPTLCYDVTHLVTRLLISAPSGIDHVDGAYGRHFAEQPAGPLVHYGHRDPRVLHHRHLDSITARLARRAWSSVTAETDAAYQAVSMWLRNAEATPPVLKTMGSRQRDWSRQGWSDRLAQARFRYTNDGGAIPKGAVYLNAAQMRLEQPRYFRWLEKRPDVTAVFMIHDLMPLDWPEFWPRGYRDRFAARIDTAFRYGNAFITTTQTVRDRLIEERARRRLPVVPIHVAPLPAQVTMSQDGLVDPALRAHPYFIIVGTIEPRKNHLMLLNVWRRFAESGAPVPKLVVVGARGWENEQTLDVLDRSVLVRPHLCEVSGLSAAGLARLMANARALLSPSFDEGYGMPVAEALSLSTPVIASDIPVFREVSQGAANFYHPLDGVGWSNDILRRAAAPWAAAPAGYTAPTWSNYFEGVRAFLDRVAARR
jgi:glycosyltransferase involved in cell wall biosynthesis